MTLYQELSSWNPFAVPTNVQSVPEVNTPAPSTNQLSFPRHDQKPVVVAFLRHCGCPWAEKTFKLMRAAAAENTNVHFVSVSHSDEQSTEKWIEGLGGGEQVEVIVDDQREIYAAYGLGASSFWAVLNPWSLSNAIKLGRSENIWNRPTESGSRWQTSGLFTVDGKGHIKYAHRAKAAEDFGDPESAMASLEA